MSHLLLQLASSNGRQPHHFELDVAATFGIMPFMDDLILTGNIVLKDRQILDMGCIPYGYFRYVQSYTFMRKYANIMRYYVDVLSYLYKEPISKTKQPDVLLQEEDKLIPAKEYFLRVCGVNK